jgi:hypothetical protein
MSAALIKQARATPAPLRGPLVVLGTSMAALSCFPVAIVPLPVHLRRYVWTGDNCGYG